MSRITVIAAAVLIAAGMAAGQTSAAPAFEVATIKAAPPISPALIAQGKVHVGMKVDGARVDIGFASIAELIRTAYEVKLYQVSGPDWLMTERFDIMAKMPDGANKDQVPAMLKALLADRFKLTVHKESRDDPVYSLVVGKNGPKMKDALPDPAAPAASTDPAASAPKGGMSVETNDGTIHMTRNPDGRGATITNPKGGTANVTMSGDGLMHMEFSKMSMPDFADTLSRYVDRPVVDDTGLKGKYQVALDVSIQDMMRIARSAGINLPGGGPAGAVTAGDGASDPGSSSVFSAVQALGLKLEPKKEPVETIVVDHVEKTPTEN